MRLTTPPPTPAAYLYTGTWGGAKGYQPPNKYFWEPVAEDTGASRSLMYPGE